MIKVETVCSHEDQPGKHQEEKAGELGRAETHRPMTFGSCENATRRAGRRAVWRSDFGFYK
jgi:hypothetical protein